MSGIFSVLGNPGSGCSTFLRTIGNDHSSFLGVKGTLNYSGLFTRDISKRFRGSVAYIPEDDVHLPTLTVRQTLEFALLNKTAKKRLHETPRFLDEFGRVFGMTHVMNTLVGDEYIRGVSGGERKRVSILESLTSNSSVNAWDGSTRGLDASSALDYIRSLRIMTDTCDRAMIVSLYQASDAIYKLMDKVMLIDEGRMVYQGPAKSAEGYFNALGYRRLEGQTMSDFLTSVTSMSAECTQNGDDTSTPRGAENLEKVFRSSQAFKHVDEEIRLYEADHPALSEGSWCSEKPKNKNNPTFSTIEDGFRQRKSKYMSAQSSYNTSFLRQVSLCARREVWQLKGYVMPLITRIICIVVCAFLLGSS